MVNKLTLIGRCGQDSRVGVTQKGTHYANVSLAVSTGKDQSQWFDVVAYDKQAEWLARATKGAVVYVEGPVTLNQYQGKDGSQKSSLSVTAYQVRLLGSRDNIQSNNTGTSDFSNDSDIPF